MAAAAGDDANLEDLLSRRDYDRALTLGMPKYRQLALAHPQDPAIHSFCLRVAVTGACRAAVVRAAAEWKGKVAKGEELTESQLGFVPGSVYKTYRSYRSPLEGQQTELSKEQTGLLAILEAAWRRQNDLALLKELSQAKGACEALTAAYFCTTRSGKDFYSDYVALGSQGRELGLIGSVVNFWLEQDQSSQEAIDVLVTAGRDMPRTEEGACYLLQAAQTRAKHGWHQEAADLYREVVSGFPQSKGGPEAQYELAQLCVKAWHNYASAVTECEKLVRLFPSSPFAARAEFLIGQYQYQDGKYQEATEAIRAFRSKHPGSNLDVHATMLLGLSLIGVGRTSEAMQEFRSIVQSHPEHELASRAQYLLGYALLSEQKYDQALSEFRKYVDQYPGDKSVPQARQFIEKLSSAKQKPAAGQ